MICKEYCTLLRISNNSNEPLYSDEDVAKIKKSQTFKQLFDIISMHMSWDEHSILTEIVDHCESMEGLQEIEIFEKKLTLCQGQQILSSTLAEKVSRDFAKFCVVINKPYKSITIEEYKNVKEYIFGNLNTNAYVTIGSFRILFHSLHIEWFVTVQAVHHMIINAYQNKDIFIKEDFVFMKIGTEVLIDTEV